MASKGWLPSCLEQRSRHNTPTTGIMLCLLIELPLATFDFESIVDLLNGIYCMAQLLEFAAFLHLRRAHKTLRRPFKIPLESTASCAILMFTPMLFCLTMLLLPFLQHDVFQIGVFICTPIFGVILYCMLELCRMRCWMHFTCSPPQGIDDVLAMQTPMNAMLSDNPQVSRNLEPLVLEAPASH